MIRDIEKENENILPNTKEMKVLRDNFPACFKTDGTFDIKRFKEYLNDKIAISNEGYELKFLGKNYARLISSLDTTTVIVPDEEHNNKAENKDSENIYISGDNIDGLKHLLKSYENKVKCIYIDPPYNTGKDSFVYNDSFNFTVEDLCTKLSVDETQAERILELTTKGSASHSAWLMFMYPRLLLARDLLTDDGVIFISIDDNEQANLKLLCDDVFGEQNYCGTIPYRKRTMKSDVPFGISQDYEWVMVYASSLSFFAGVPVKRKYYSSDDYPNDRWRLSDLTTQKIESQRPNSAFDLVDPKTNKVYKYNPKRLWAITKDTFPEYYSKGKIVFPDDYEFLKITIPSYRVFESEDIEKSLKNYGTEEPLKSFSTVLSNDVGMNEQGSKELDALVGNKVFSFPKPTSLIYQFLLSIHDKNAIILDFFSGSGSTAHAVMKLNAEDEGNRKFIMVQLPEKTDEDSEARKNGYETIDQIGMERITRAAKQIKEQYPDTAADLGFKHYTLQEPDPNTLDKLENFVLDEQGLVNDNDVLSCFGLPTVLTTWLVHDGYGFNADVQTIDFEGYTGYFYKEHLYLINENITTEAISSIVDKLATDKNFQPKNVILFGYSFTWTKTEEIKINIGKFTNISISVRY